MAGRHDEGTSARRALSLDGQQVGYLMFGAFIIAGLVFAAGFAIGRQAAAGERAPVANTYACLEVLDEANVRPGEARPDEPLPHLRYEDRLTAEAPPALPRDPALHALANDRDDLELPGTPALHEPLPEGVPGAAPAAPAASPVPDGRFTLRVKSFHAESEAARFAHDLASRGHAAFVHPGASDTGRVFEVLVGGFAQREEAERFQRGFEHSEAIDGTSLLER